MVLTTINSEESMKKDEIRARFEYDRTLSLAVYEEDCESNSKIISNIKMGELLEQDLTLFDGFIRWIIKFCGESCNVKVTRELLNSILESIVD